MIDNSKSRRIAIKPDSTRSPKINPPSFGKSRKAQPQPTIENAIMLSSATVTEKLPLSSAAYPTQNKPSCVAELLKTIRKRRLSSVHPRITKQNSLTDMLGPLGTIPPLLEAEMKKIYDGEGMKSIPDPDTTPDEKMTNFQDGLRRVLNCSKTQLNSAIEYEKKIKEGKPKRGPKPSSSGRASRAKH